MKYLALTLILAGCSMFHDDEKISISNPKPGMELDIKQEPLPVQK